MMKYKPHLLHVPTRESCKTSVGSCHPPPAPFLIINIMMVRIMMMVKMMMVKMMMMVKIMVVRIMMVKIMVMVNMMVMIKIMMAKIMMIFKMMTVETFTRQPSPSRSSWWIYHHYDWKRVMIRAPAFHQFLLSNWSNSDLSLTECSESFWFHINSGGYR